MKYIFPLLFAAACSSTPSALRNELRLKRFPGTWTYTDMWGNKQKSHVSISCEGVIEYNYKNPEALMFKDVGGSGRIVDYKDNNLVEKSFFGGYTMNHYVSEEPTKDENGCWHLSIEGKTYDSEEPYDCERPSRPVMEELTTALKNSQSPKCK